MIKDVLRDLNKISSDTKYTLFEDGYKGVCIAKALDEGTIEPITPWKADSYELMDWIEGEWERFEAKREAHWKTVRGRKAERVKARRKVDVLSPGAV